jgi:uncharacterized protein (DUF934 family)
MSDKILWRDNAAVQDGWSQAETDEGSGQVILPLSAYLALTKEQRMAGANRLGVLIQPLESIDAIVEDLPNLPLIALAFPAYTNGTSNSKAAMLVEHYEFSGEIRAVGDILFDQIPLMIRNGFTSFEIVNGPTIAQLTSGKKGGIAFQYQPAARPSPTAKSYVWRHKEAS